MTNKESSPVSELVPVAWRARHSEQENWYLHDSPVGWWQCQALVPVSEAADRLTALEAENAKLRGHIVEAQKILCEPQDEMVRLVRASITLAQALTAPKGGEHGE